MAQWIVADASRDSTEAALPLTRRRKLSGLRSQSNCFGGVGWRRSVAIFLIGVGFCFPAFADMTPIIYSKDFNLPIPSPNDPDSEYSMGRMDDAIIIVPEPFLIRDVDVAVGLTHGAFFDLEIILQSPEGTKVVLNPAGNLAFIVKDEKGVRPVGGSAQWLFDDEADVSIEQATEPYSGPYQPVELLSAFDGESMLGEWSLQICDWWPAHTGSLDRLELIFTVPEPATAILLVFATFLAVITRPQKKQTMDVGRD